MHEKTAIMLSNRAYDKMKWVTTLVLPAFGTLYFTIAAIWGLPRADEVVGTTVAVSAFMGAVLGLSARAYEKSGDKFDGDLVVMDQPDGTKVMSLELTKLDDPLQVAEQKQVVFKVKDMT